MEETYDRGGKMPTFDGNPRNFANWWKKFLAYATMIEFKDILKEVRDVNLPESEVSEESEEITKEQRIAIRKNEVAMASFSMAFTTDKAMNMVYAASTEGWQEGEAYLVVRELMKKYRPLDTVSKIEMRQELTRIKMRKGMDPSLLFKRLTLIQNQYLGPGNRLDKEELIAIVLDVAKEEYCAILTVERKLKGNLLTVEDLERVMTEEFRQNARHYGRLSAKEGEMLLFQNLGACYNCGKPGHRANECTAKRNNNQNFRNHKNFPGKCGTCGLRGHTTKDCWTREENKHRRPPNWKKPTNEKAAIAIETKKDEKIVEYGWALEDIKKILTDPQIWIADTGAAVHSTSNAEIARNWKGDTNNTVVVMGNGQKEEVTKIGKVEGIARNKTGESQGNIVLSDVMFLPNGRYNLISITKVMRDGWKLEGDENQIKLEKGNKTFIFDTKIETSRGVLFAVKIDSTREVMAASSDQGNIKQKSKQVNINDAHSLLGHLSEKAT